MINTVTIGLETYDELRDRIHELENEIKIVKEEHNKELKEIFKIREAYSSVGLTINYGKIIKEIYGEKIELDDESYILSKNKELSEIAYDVWIHKEED